MIKNYRVNKLSAAVASALISSALTSPLAFSQDLEEEVVVTGFRKSLEAAVDAKRNSQRIMDAIVAEDIGKLPDNNIAEALQRITGVSINRDFGVGSEVSIRGLPQNRVELNGRSTLGDDRNGINFQDFPSSFLSAVEVVKSPTPDMIEGALGGTISLKTARPLELKDRLAAASLDFEYADKADNWAPIFSGAFGDSWDLDNGGTFGAIFAIAYQDRELRRDESLLQLQVSEVDFNNDGVIDTADDASNTPSGNYVYGREHTFNPRTETRERTAFNLLLEWAPSDAGKFYIDLNQTERSGNQEAFSILHVSGTPVSTPGVTYEDGNGQLQAFRYESVLPILTSASNFRNTDSFSHAIGGEWNFTEKLKVSGELAIAESDSYEPTTEFRFRGIERALEEANPAETNQWYVPVFFENSQNSAPTVDFDDGFVFADRQNQAFRRYEDTRDFTLNEETAFKFDVEYAEPFGFEWVSSVKTGMRFTSRDYKSERYQLRLTNIYRFLEDADGNPDIIWMEDIANQFSGSITDHSWNDAFEHTGRSGAYDLAHISAFNTRLLQNQQATFDIVQQLLNGTNYQINGSLADNLEYQDGSYSAISEDTSALYLQFNLDFGSVNAVVGGRYVETDIESGAYQDVTDESGDVVRAIVTDGTTYSDFLPSLNLTWNMTDETLMRFAAGKVMRRADFDELSPAYNFLDAYTTATRGNPSLKPFRATQYDLSIEHYFGEGNLLSATVFYKDVESFLRSDSFCADLPDVIATQTNRDDFEKICVRPTVEGDSDTWTYATDPDSQIEFMGIETTTRTNGESGKIQGFEIGYQQAFDFLPGAWSGLGLNANYTYADSEDPDGVPLEDISENTFNTQFYYEYGGFGIRLAYTFRDRFLDDYDTKRVRPLGDLVDPAVDDPTAGNNYREDLEQWDMSANYDISDQFTVVANITNLTAEPTINTGTNGTAFQIMETDRRYSIGVRAKF